MLFLHKRREVVTSLLMTSLGRKSIDVRRVSSQALETTEGKKMMLEVTCTCIGIKKQYNLKQVL